MSESVSDAAAPAAAPPPAAPPPDVISGPAKDQPSISVSEAARLMRARRTEAAQQAAAPPQQGEARANPTTQGNGEARATTPSAADQMAQALGVPVDQLRGQVQQATAPPAGSEAAATEFEFDGRRYAADELRALIREGGAFTQKTQALAAQQRQVQAQAEALAQVLPYIQPEIQRLTQSIQQVPLPDNSLIETNPQEYLRQQAHYAEAVREQQRLAGLTQLQAEAHNRAMAQQVEAANAQLAQEFPQWADPKTRSQWQQDIVAWATDKGGYTHDQLRGLTDAAHLRTMIKAMQFDRWVANVKTAAPAPQLRTAPVRGQAPPPAPAAQVQAAEQAFDQRPNVRNAAALLSARRSQ